MPPPIGPGEQKILTLLGQIRAELLARIEDTVTQGSLEAAAVRHDLQERLGRIDAQNTAIWQKLNAVDTFIRRPQLPPAAARSSPKLEESAADGIRIAQLTKQLEEVRVELGKKQDQERAADKAEIERFRGSQTYWVRYVVGAVAGAVIALLIFALTHPWTTPHGP